MRRTTPGRFSGAEAVASTAGSMSSGFDDAGFDDAGFDDGEGAGVGGGGRAHGSVLPERATRRNRCSVVLHVEVRADRGRRRQRALRHLAALRARPLAARHPRPRPVPAAARLAASHRGGAHPARPAHPLGPHRRAHVDARLPEPASDLAPHPPRRRVRRAPRDPGRRLPRRPHRRARARARRVRRFHERGAPTHRAGTPAALGHVLRAVLAADARRARGRRRVSRPPDRAVGRRRDAERPLVPRGVRPRRRHGPPRGSARPHRRPSTATDSRSCPRCSPGALPRPSATGRR